MDASFSSSLVIGLSEAAFSSSDGEKSGFGSARLFTLRFWLYGIASICIVTAGTIYGGFSARIKSFIFSMSIFSSEQIYAAIYLPPAGLSYAATVASVMPL